jgi:hypothetical protein
MSYSHGTVLSLCSRGVSAACAFTSQPIFSTISRARLASVHGCMHACNQLQAVGLALRAHASGALLACHARAWGFEGQQVSAQAWCLSLSPCRSAPNPYSLKKWLLGLTGVPRCNTSFRWFSRTWVLERCGWTAPHCLRVADNCQRFQLVRGTALLMSGMGLQGAANKHWLWTVLCMESMLCLHALSPLCMQAQQLSMSH